MRKIEFFNDLENALKMLKVEKIDEILRDYEEIFIERAQAGQTEEKIIASLGEPLEIALNYINSSTNRNIKEEISIEALTSIFEGAIYSGYDTFLIGMAVGFDTLCFKVLTEIRKKKT